MTAWALFCHDFDLSKGINILSEKCPVVLDHYRLNETHFLSYLDIPKSLQAIEDCQYISASSWDYLEQKLRQATGATLYLYLTEQDLADIQYNPDCKSKLMQWVVLYQVKLILCIGDLKHVQNAVVQNELYGLIQAGIRVAKVKFNTEARYEAAQLQLPNTQVPISLLKEVIDEEVGGFFAQNGSALFVSQALSLWEVEEVDTTAWYVKKNNIMVPFNHELDGDINTFGQRFLELIQKQWSAQDILKQDSIVSIHYTDRYLKTPLALLLLLSISHALSQMNIKPIQSIQIETVERKTEYQRSYSSHIGQDWQRVDDQKAVYQTLFSLLGVDFKLNIRSDNQSTSHGRFLTLQHESGKTTTIAFDQGMGYWNRCHFSSAHAYLRHFPFSETVDKQNEHLQKVLEKGFEVRTPYEWPSYVVVQYV